ASDSETDAIERTKQAEESLKDLHLQTKLVLKESDAEKYWIIRRESFNMLRHHVSGMRTAPFIDDFVIKPEELGDFLPQIYAILDKYHMLYTIAGHVGDGNVHIIPLMKLGDKTAPEVIKEVGKQVYDLVLQHKGSITGEHNDGIIRSPYLAQMFG